MHAVGAQCPSRRRARLIQKATQHAQPLERGDGTSTDVCGRWGILMQRGQANRRSRKSHQGNDVFRCRGLVRRRNRPRCLCRGPTDARLTARAPAGFWVPTGTTAARAFDGFAATCVRGGAHRGALPRSALLERNRREATSMLRHTRRGKFGARAAAPRQALKRHQGRGQPGKRLSNERPDASPQECALDRRDRR